jgi:DNA-binding transcriptional MerR regulator/methylmalonyl-CoA mutase cobalamin-binding subunit
MSELHPIKVVARQTGLSPHAIRAWEKRYKAVIPRRTPTNRRVYTNEDIDRLLLLRRATLLGRSIGQVAKLSTDELRQLVEEYEVAEVAAPRPVNIHPSNEFVAACLRATQTLDAERLVTTLERASVSMSRPALVEQVIAPLLETIGDRWREGSLRIAGEHLATATIRTFLGNMNGTFPVASDAPRLLVTTPAGQVHELGALIAAAAASAEGWRVAYLGPSLPAEDIGAAAETNRSRAVALSIVLAGDFYVKSELEKLGHLLPENVGLLVGGRGAVHYDEVLRAIGAKRITDFPSLRAELEALRNGPRIRKVS